MGDRAERVGIRARPRGGPAAAAEVLEDVDHRRDDHRQDEGDYVTTSWVARGTHEGEFHGIPPTGVEIEMPGVTLYRFEDERVAEGWTHRDASDVLRQLGVGEESA